MFVRMSMVRPLPGEDERVAAVFRRMNALACGKPGFLCAQILVVRNGADLVRFACYEDERTATAVATSERMLALRAELHRLIEPGHVEHGLVGLDDDADTAERLIASAGLAS